MIVAATAKDENRCDNRVFAACVRFEPDSLSEVCQATKESHPEFNKACSNSSPAPPGEKTRVAAEAANVPPPEDHGTLSPQMTGHEPDRRDSDDDLISRIRNGDEVALGDVYDRYEGLLYSVSRHILQDIGAVEEVMQDTFYHLWRVAPSFDPARGTLGCWLLVMARNRSIDRLRRQPPGMEEVAAATLIGSVHHIEPDIESVVAGNEMVARVRAALRDLPDTHRVLMELAYFEGLTQNEIAKCTGEPLGTVKTRLKAAVASLKAHFGIVNAHP